ncbi:MAG: hypothetical protein AABW48_01595 [Nanoarchaeota archaeon]
MNTTKLNQLITVTALTLGTLLSGCKKADYNDITPEIINLKKEFINSCERKSNHNIYDGELDAIVQQRNQLLAANGYDRSEQWWCRNDGKYQASFPHTQFPNPAGY